MAIGTGNTPRIGVSGRACLSALRCGVWLAVAATAAGCAAHRPTTIADRFVRHGKPSIDLGGAPLSETGTYLAQLRKLATEARPRAKVLAPDAAEAHDPRLRASLSALRAAPSAQAHRAVALEYRRIGVLDAAHSHLSAAIRLSPRDASLFDLRARLWRAWRLPRLGLPDARKALSLAPQSATVWNTLGLLLEASGGIDQAVDAYRHAVLLDEGADYAWNNLCHVWMERGDAKSAVRACRRTLDLDPSYRFAELNLYRAERLLAGPPALPPAVTELATVR